MKKYNIHALLHVPYESLGCIEQWIIQQNYSLTVTKLYENFTLPELADFDWLIVMGGPMSVYEESNFTWLVEEKQFIRTAIENGNIVLGICLGSQLIANALGAKVYPNTQKEIGWFNIYPTQNITDISIFDHLPAKFKVFHWHGDTYDLPANSQLLFQSDCTANQAFMYNKNVIGLQFHLEILPDLLNGMVQNGMSELIANGSVQSAETILNEKSFLAQNNKLMYQIMDYLSAF